MLQFGQSACDLAQENGFDDIAERLHFEENFGKELDPTAKLPTQVEEAPTAVPQVKASSASQVRQLHRQPQPHCSAAVAHTDRLLQPYDHCTTGR